MNENLEKLKYPIGKFRNPSNIGKQQIKVWIETIQNFSEKLNQEVCSLNEQELDKTYRQGGWTIKQVVNHCADSHMNSLIRFKLTLTEEIPTIKPYAENLWAELADSKNHPIESSLKILEGLHERWTTLLKSLSETDLERRYRHPVNNDLITLKAAIGLYAWHCDHHLEHVKNAKKK